MRSITIVCVLLASCTPGEDSTATDASLSNSVAVCREGPSALSATSGSAVEMVLLAVLQTQANDVRCGPPPEAVRICRALFVLSVVDPANNLDEPDDLARSHDAVSWVLRDAASAADDSTLVAAFLELDHLNHDLVAAADDDARVQILQQRARPSILDPIETAWSHCA